MRRIVVLLAALVALVACASTLAAAKTKHHVTATVLSVDVAHTGTPPMAGSTVTNAALVQATPGGNGAATAHLVFSGLSGNAFGFTGTQTAFLAHGSISATLKGTGTVQANGSLVFSGTATTTGGTDSYKGAKGKLSFTGSSPGVNQVVTLKFTGTLTY